MSELPKGWKLVSLKDISSKPQYGYTTKSTNDGAVKYLRTTDLTSGNVNWDLVPFCAEPPTDITKYLLVDGDIVISRAGSVGFHSLIKKPPQNTVFASYLIRFKPLSCVKPQYLSHFFNSKGYWEQITKQSAGVAVQNVNATKLSELLIPIAPLNEQIRIANKLDSILAKVDKAQARLDKIPAILKRFRQSVLAAATSGELTSSKVEGWQNSSLSKLLSAIADCPHSTPKWTEEGKLCVRTTAFKPFKLDLSSQGYVSEETYIQRTKRLKPLSGDILYSREGAILGIACQIPSGIELCMGQRMLVMRAANDIDAKYLTIYLNSPKITDIVKTLTLGNAAPRINMSTIKNFDISYPTPSEQREIVEVVERLFTKADKVEQQYLDAKARLDRLTQSILAKAFRGELVPQDPNDEPAEKLLERIVAEKELSKPKKVTRKRATKAKTAEEE
ncbi:restriction endonuclease subunit S [Vibrio aestuarianus subsp. cardii]|uniref:restriction endonuclease subunit S n=1 Tax=Vibrio aestuarianus TaxID=28171 RepID=UPI0015584DA2|nr:restriction endonuclease subunit S [Vibrio aestuarianus subsp. cardii]